MAGASVQRLLIVSLAVGVVAGLAGQALCEDTSNKSERPFSGPLMMRNDNPLYLTLFSTALPDRAQTIASGHWSWDLGYLDTNTIFDQANVTGADNVLVDGEMQRFELNLRYGLKEHLELSCAIPYLYFGGGYLDGFIQSFEDSFGFVTPGARESRGKGQFRYLFQVTGDPLIDKSDDAIHGMADLPIQLKFQFRDERQGLFPRMAVRGMLKLPTATDPVLGNGRLDGGVGLLVEQPVGRRLLLFSNLDVTSTHLPLALKTIDLVPVMASGSFGFEHFLTDRASWKMQCAVASNPYPDFHHDLTALTRVPAGVGLGWTYRFPPRTTLKLSVVENMDMAWPDFEWGFSLENKW